jgi:hypothetical protein
VPSGGGPGGGPAGAAPARAAGEPFGAGTPCSPKHFSYAPCACGAIELVVTAVDDEVVPGEVEFDEQAAASATTAAMVVNVVHT